MTPPTPAAELPADLEAGLRRLKLAAIRRAAPDILLTAKTQRWKPEETLRVLVDLEIAARDESNCRNRMNAARFPVDKTLDEFNVDESSIPRASHDYLITLDWITRADNLCLVGPAGTGKTHYLIALGPCRRRSPASSPLLHRHRSGRAPLASHRRQHRRQNHRTALPQPVAHHRRDRLRAP